MTGPGRRFDPSELHDVDGAPLTDAESAALLGTARDLETFARAESIAPTSGFEDRVMTAIAAEPPPRAVATGGWLAGFAVVVRDAWRITWSGGGRPIAVRAQAFALVLLVVVAFGSLGTAAAVGVSRLLTGDPTTAPSVDPSIVPPTPSFPTPSIAPSPMPSPSTSPSPSASETDESGESSEPSESPDGTDDSDGTPRPTASPRPTSDPTDTPEPTDDDDDETPEPTDDDDDKTPKPSETPDPDDTPDSSDD